MLVSVGLHLGHDGGCAVLVDGQIGAALPEERLTRQKCARGCLFSLATCLSTLGLRPADIDAVVVSNSGVRLPDNPRLDPLDFLLPAGVRKHSIDHHLAHATGAYCLSSFPRAVSVVLDSGGNDGKTSAAIEFGPDGFAYVEEPRVVPRHHSLTRTYEAFTNLFGFADHEAGKTMALAAYGDPSALGWRLFDLLPDGQVRSRLTDSHQWGAFAYLEQHGISPSYLDPRSTLACNIAAALQQQFTEGLLHHLEHVGRLAPLPICLSGGAALNCIANGHVRGMRGRTAFFMPSPGDAGLGLGNACYGHYLLTGCFPKVADVSMRYGPKYDSRHIEAALHRDPEYTVPGFFRPARLEHSRSSTMYQEAAAVLRRGGTVALWSGRSEYGPRALCGRSILASPRQPEMRDHLNGVKRREWFRPLAPVMSMAAAEAYFSGHSALDELRYMVEAVTAPETFRDSFPSAVHVDGTSRPQVLCQSADASEPISAILAACYERETEQVLVNTSFNIGEPIVETPEEALATFAHSSVDLLILDEFLVWRRAS